MAVAMRVVDHWLAACGRDRHPDRAPLLYRLIAAKLGVGEGAGATHRRELSD
jgi:hypothetical protein